MGQVWSSADFDGINAAEKHGGRGSVLAVTLQDPGPDGIDGTADDTTAPLNREPADVSIDFVPNDTCGHASDRIRNFISNHPAGAQFLLGDGSVRTVSENIDDKIYREVSTIGGGEMIGGGEVIGEY